MTDPITIDDLGKQLDANLAALDFTAPIDVIAEDLCDTHSDYFGNQADPNGSPWAPLAPVTVKNKGHSIILIETTEMFKSVTNRKHSGHVETITPDSLSWGTDDPKAVFHKEGTSRMPQRPFVGWSEASVDSACDVIADAAVTQLLAGI